MDLITGYNSSGQNALPPVGKMGWVAVGEMRGVVVGKMGGVRKVLLLEVAFKPLR